MLIKEQWHKNMQNIKDSNTKKEILLRKVLCQKGIDTERIKWEIICLIH